jgi:hypothetical protein
MKTRSLAAAVAAVLLGPITAWAIPSVVFTPSAATVNTGDTLAITVGVTGLAAGGLPLSDYDLAVSFDPSLMSLATSPYTLDPAVVAYFLCRSHGSTKPRRLPSRRFQFVQSYVRRVGHLGHGRGGEFQSRNPVEHLPVFADAGCTGGCQLRHHNIPPFGEPVRERQRPNGLLRPGARCTRAGHLFPGSAWPARRGCRRAEGAL